MRHENARLGSTLANGGNSGSSQVHVTSMLNGSGWQEIYLAFSIDHEQSGATTFHLEDTPREYIQQDS